MKKYLCLIVFLILASATAAIAQTDDYARLASDSFDEGHYSQALVYCSMHAAENAYRLPIEKKVKLCLEYERRFDEASLDGDVSLARVFCEKITALNPADKRIVSRMADLESRADGPRPTQGAKMYGPSKIDTQSPSKRIPDYFNIEATIMKDLEVSFSMSRSCFLLGVDYGYDIWKGNRMLTQPVVLYKNGYDTRYDRLSHIEIVHPMHLMAHAGLFFNYFSVGCGFGYVFAKTRTATYSRFYSEESSGHEYSDEKNVAFFSFRPEVKVFIPFGRDGNARHWIFTFGYNVVKEANCTEGITLSTGWGRSF